MYPGVSILFKGLCLNILTKKYLCNIIQIMAIRFKRKFKKTFRKRKFARKRTFSKKKSAIQYDGMIKVKMQATKELINTDIDGRSTMQINWGNQLAPPAANELNV